MNFAHRRPGEAEDDVQVMDHEVKDHVDIERAGREDAEAMRLKEHRPVEQGLHGEDGGIESLQMASLHDATMLAGDGDEVVDCRCAGGDGLFDQ